MKRVYFLPLFLFLISKPVFLPSQPLWSLPAHSFDADKAFKHLEKQCDFGPRVSGLPGHMKCRNYIISELGKTGLKAQIQPFDAYSKMMGKVMNFENIIAKIDTPSTTAIALSCHWDSRPVSDMDRNPRLRNRPITGANDGASGVAVLLEIARILKEFPPPVDVYFLFFDAEDYGMRNDLSQYCLGSQFFVKNQPKDFKIEVGVNLDLVADFDQEFKIEQYSQRGAKKFVDQIWNIGKKHYPKIFVTEVIPPILDDHVPFIQAGIPYLDIIDLEYEHWHTSKDTPENCSVESLERVGKVVVEWLFTESTFQSD